MKRVWMAGTLLMFGAPASADVLLVHADGSGAYHTIQSAIDAAVDGDEVVLTSGTYRGVGNREVRFRGKAITVRSKTRSATDVTINPQSYYPIRRSFVFENGEGPGSVLQGIAISCGYVNEGMETTGSVLIRDASPTFLDCSFLGANGRAVLATGDSAPHFERCYWAYNWIVKVSATALSAPAATLIDCTFYDNGNDDAVGTASIGRAFMQRCTVTESSTWGFCGALAVGDGSVLEDCSINGWAYFSGGSLCTNGNVILRRVSLGTSETGAPALSVGGCVTLVYCDIPATEISPPDACVRRVELGAGIPESNRPEVDNSSWGQIKAAYR